MTLMMSRAFRSFFLIALIIVPWGSASATMQDFPVVKMQSLDKVTARTETFEAKVGTTIQFGPLYIRVQACRKSDPIDEPESAAFIQVWEVPPETGKSEWVFSGWMFASSPALSAMDHPVYDVWVLDCLEQDRPNKAAEESEAEEAIAPEEEATAEGDPFLESSE
ncbi:MAG: DUF2155 domain-containing protein [Pseudomonadota bacterium]